MKASVALKLSTSLKATPTRELMEDRTALSDVNLDKTTSPCLMYLTRMGKVWGDLNPGFNS